MRVVVLGGAGNFGARIVRALHGQRGLDVVVAGRRRGSVAIDIQAPDFAQQLASAAPHVVVHCVGPFQGQDYRVALAALNCGAHYIDLADGRDFVAGFASAVSAAAIRAGRAAVTGASTLPALSSAVVETLRQPLCTLEKIEIAISPAQTAARGAATLQAVFSYLGRPIAVWRDGRWTRGWGMDGPAPDTL